ncbi:hypothetical protein L1987_45638 [Smallanthus sonchifolius]|uniref:Uncharacterized protein n=1 Tax=Smallanthus sonchifolius TaxID=185202 RepID=A0ACB9FY41_9ASTR|nr:hypothetical protein L1987_45638 [Smallanthus sonchifolius]
MMFTDSIELLCSIWLCPEVASIKELKDHPVINIIGNLQDRVEPKNVEMSLSDNNWIEAMQEELAQFDKLKVWNLVDLPKGVYPIGTKWVFKCKKDDRGVVVRNKARLVVQGFNQQEGIDYTKVYAHVARLEAIRLFLAFASYKGFKVFQLDVKSVFLYGKVKEEVYVCQPRGFEDPLNPNRVFKLYKALYGLHQAPRAWYETLSAHLLANDFVRGKIDSTLFIKKSGGDYLLVHIYVDDIIFGSTNEGLCKDFESVMKSKFEMSAMGELSFFLGLQVNQKEDGFFIHQSKFQAKPKESHLIAVKRIFRYLKGKQRLGLWYPHGSNFDSNAYTDSDFGGCCLDRKSTTGGCQFLGTPMLIDNNATMSITNNPVKHSKTKHIEIRYHFIRDCAEKRLIELVKVHTDDNFADLFTKAFDRTRFEFLIKMIDNSWILIPESVDSHYTANSLESSDSESS